MDQLPETLIALYSHRLRESGPNVAIHVPLAGGAFRQVTWDELAADVRRLAGFLRSRNVTPGDRVVQVSENRYEWIVCELATLVARAIHVAVHATLSGPQIAYQIADSGARVVIVSGPQQAAKLAGPGVELPAGLAFFSHDTCADPLLGSPVRRLADAFQEIPDQASRGLEEEAIAQTRPDDIATILYSSGTTGEPKGVMLTQRNLASNAVASCEAFESQPDDLRLCWLPLSHIFARTVDMYTWIVRGSQLALAENRDRILANCASLHPTLMNGVPYFFDKVHRYLVDQKKAEAPGVLKELLGGRMRLCCSGGAALNDSAAEFFWKQGVPLVQGYGLTESSPVITISTLQASKTGTVGRPIRDVEVRIAADGEVLTRGPHVMLGYWKKPDATAETVRDGWLLTGDLGEIDGEGFLRITGRKKELIVTAGGKNVAPVQLEGLLTQDSLIQQAVVIGDARKYLVALIVPNPDALRAEIAERHIPVQSNEQALTRPEVLDLYRQRIDQRLSAMSHCEQIARFTLLDRAFSVENDELTPTLKLRRKVIAAHFAPQIEAMYAEPSGKFECGPA